jgi:hypothetical protein
MIAALNDLEILAADIGNAYLNAPTREKVYTIAGPEFGSRQGQTVIIKQALYGLKSSGAAWRAHLAETLNLLGFTSSLADADVWMRPAVKPSGEHYYEYVLVYVDDILAISAAPQITMDALSKLYRLKEPASKPKKYLGADVFEHFYPDEPNRRMWGFSSHQFVKEALRVVELELSRVSKKLSTKASTPMYADYRPELDVTALLDERQANYYQELIGILRWAVELGRIDIHVQVAMLSSFLAQPRVGHLDAVFRIFAYLKAHDRSKLVFDASTPIIDERRFIKQDWEDFYRDAKEAIPPNMPEPRGKEVEIHCFVDADHAGDRLTRRSQTGIIIFLNRAPIIWYSKKQNTVETSTFGSEFIAMKTAIELIEALRYKLRMFGIPIVGAANIYCDNESVVHNTTKPESTLKKKHNAIAYHRVREAVAAGTVRIAKEDTKTNIADMLTKCVNRESLTGFCECLFA